MFEIVDILVLATNVVGVASAVAALVPKAEKLGVVLSQVRKVLDLLALNVGNAKNAK
jgi:hypothetical protein